MTRRTWLAAALATTAIAIVAAGAWRVRPPFRANRSDHAGLAELIAARPARHLDGRLAGFEWTPKATVTRSGSAAPTLSPDLRIAIARTELNLSKQRSPEALRAYATGRLLLGEIDAGSRALEEVILRQPDAASPRSDLAAALLAKSAEPDHAFELPRALEEVEHAIALDSRQPEANFNRALVLERLHLRPQAAAAWQRYLGIDSSTPWATEARGHVRPAAADAPEDAQLVRDRLFDDVLARWASAVTAGDWPRARDVLAEADRLNATLVASGTDTFARDVIATARRVSESPREKARVLASGHTAFAAARAAYLRDEFDASAPAFDSARRDLERSGSPLAAWAQVHRAILQYRQNHLDAAIRLFEEARKTAAGRPYNGVLGKADWGLGLIAALRGDSRTAAGLYRRSIRELAAANETQNQASVFGLLATNYDELGDPARSWVARIEALAGTAREGVLLRASFEADRAQLPRAALVFAEAAAAQASLSRRTTNYVDALRWQAVIVSKLGDRTRARALLDQARKEIGSRTGSAWDRLRAETDVAAMLSADATNAREGIEAASRALEYFESSDVLNRTPQMYVGRARLQRALGRTDEAQADLDRGLAAVQRLRRHVDAGPDQATLSDSIRGLVEEAVDLQISAGNVDAAFALSDAARGRDLSSAEPAMLDAQRIRAAIPAGTSVLEYAIGEQRSYLWLLRHESMQFARLDIGRAALSRMVDAVTRASYVGPDATALRQVLFGQIERSIGARDALVVVPDGPLHTLSFAALPGREQRFLIEEHPIVYGVSAGVWTGVAPLAAGPAASSGAPLSPLIVTAGAPLADAEAYPDLSALPDAPREARAVAQLYPNGRVATGADVTREWLVRAVASSDIVHFAGHAIVHPLSPLRSELVVADKDGRGLTAADIRGLRDVRARLVVLAACESSGGLLTQSEGPLGLARAFMAAGVPTVVATRWKLDDFASLEFFTAFHRAYRRGGSAMAAVQEAQRTMLAAPDARLRNADVWAGIAVFGR